MSRKVIPPAHWCLEFVFSLYNYLIGKNVHKEIIRKAHWLLPSSFKPLLENLCVDLLCIFSMFVVDVADFSSSGIIQEKETKQGVLGADLLGDVDPSLCPSEPDQL